MALFNFFGACSCAFNCKLDPTIENVVDFRSDGLHKNLASTDANFFSRLFIRAFELDILFESVSINAGFASNPHFGHVDL